MLLHPISRRKEWVLLLACSMCFVGLWIEKGMGLIVPGFIPSTLHEIVEYSPSMIEWKVMVGIWALGLMIFTVALKIAIPVLTGRASLGIDVGLPESPTGQTK